MGRNAFPILLLTLLAGCARTPGKPKDSKGTADAMSELAATLGQARLWKEASAQGAKAGLEKAPLADRPVQPRARVKVQNRPVQSRTVDLPKGLVSGIRIISSPDLPEGRFSGKAQVVRAEGERLDLDLGQQRILTLNVRVRGGAIRTKAGGVVQLDYRVRDDAFDRQLILAMRTEDQDGIASVLDGGKRPVTVQIPLFQLTATQVGKPDKSTMVVEVRVGDVRQVLSQGKIVQFPRSRLTVGLVASTAYSDKELGAIEGNPYAINLVAWPSQ